MVDKDKMAVFKKHKHRLQAFSWENPHYFLYYHGTFVPLSSILHELCKTEDCYKVFDKIEGCRDEYGQHFPDVLFEWKPTERWFVFVKDNVEPKTQMKLIDEKCWQKGHVQLETEGGFIGEAKESDLIEVTGTEEDPRWTQ